MATELALAVDNQCVIHNGDGDRSTLHELCNFFSEKVIKDLKLAHLEVCSVRLLLAHTPSTYYRSPLHGTHLYVILLLVDVCAHV